MNKTITMLLLVLPSFANANSNISFDFGGWSKHLYEQPEHVKKIAPYKENHNVWGLRYTSGFDNDPSYKWSLGANYMKDSFGFDAYSLAAGWYYNIDLPNDFYIDVGGTIGMQHRSWTDKVYHDRIDFKMVTVPFIAPELKFGYKRIYTSIMLFPNVRTPANGNPELVEPTLFLQFGVDLINVN
ncbi:hypothetical protein OTK49_01955 [Vibrio coralliirubri]|uniref:hypothetical protein n=1 Tax=Vibrio coralliirubri TaxID=1516159 RepID=UPI002284BF33|nr:hypothetical protein [Vibrio coralliirubri]MCY9861278.1 hypothetical protein [Vibrio coralliirubri]